MHRMSSFIILLVYHSCLPTTQGLSLSCPSLGVQTTGRNQIGDPTQENSWEDCAAKCSREKTCSFWSWVNPTGGYYALRCAIMKGVSGTKRESSVISGEKTCQGSSQNLNPPQNQNKRPTSKPSSPAYKPPVTIRPTYVTITKPVDCIDWNKSISNQDQIHKNGIQKWEQCSEECRKESGCIYWTWMTKTSPRNALKCFLLVENKRQEKRQVPITREDRNAISGKPGAVDCQPQADASHSGEGISVTTMFMVLYSIVVVVLLMAVCVYNIHSAVKRGKSS